MTREENPYHVFPLCCPQKIFRGCLQDLHFPSRKNARCLRVFVYQLFFFSVRSSCRSLSNAQMDPAKLEKLRAQAAANRIGPF